MKKIKKVLAKDLALQYTIQAMSEKLVGDGHLAQLGEHLFDVQKVIGSIPIVPTTRQYNAMNNRVFYFLIYIKSLKY